METRWTALPVVYMYHPEKTGESLVMDTEVMGEMIRQLLADGRGEFAERGGILGCDSEGRICAFHLDTLGSSNACTYLPDSDSLERIVKVWQKENSVSFAGIIHTHRQSADRLSGMDLLFTKAMLKCNPEMRKVYMPVLAGTKLTVYAFERDFLSSRE